MSFVPLQGVATLLPQRPRRESSVRFSGVGGRGVEREVELPIAAAIPILSRSLRADPGDTHPTVRLLGAAVVLALKLVAARRIVSDEDGWRVGPLGPDDAREISDLAGARRGDLDAEAAELVITSMMHAVADTLTKPDETAGSGATESPGRPAARANRRISRAVEEPGLPVEVSLSLRIESPDEMVEGGRFFGVLQAHDKADLTKFVDAADLWTGLDHGFSAKARISAAVELRKAAQAWEPLAELQRRPVPDRIEIDAVTLSSLLEGGTAALLRAGVDVYWPRNLETGLTSRARVERVREEKLMDGLFGPQALFEFDWRLALRTEAGEQELTDDEMAELATSTSPIIKLRNNWVLVDPGLARRARRRIGKPKAITPVQAIRASLTGVLDLAGEEIQVHPGATLERIRDQVADAKSVSPIPPPPGLAATLRDYQARGATWLTELTGLGLGACLADDMGLGKTITLIALHLHRRARGLLAGPTLVVCPTSLIGNWEAELRRFAPEVAVRRFHGTQRDLTELGTGFVLTSYGTMRRDHETLATVDWDLVVADEAQHIKNPMSSTAKNLRTIESAARVALTGTPVENDLTELWAILDWTTPGLLGSRAAFRKRWAAPIESGVDPELARQFSQLVDPFILRRRKSDPGIAPELPPKTETDHPVGLTKEQVVLYESLVRTSMEKIAAADEDARRGLVLALLTGLKQICNHPAHYLRQASGRLTGRSEKFELLDELIGTIVSEDSSVLLFTQYVAMARLIERHLAETGVPNLLLHGGTPVASRERMVRDFQAGKAKVFLLSLKAGGTGLNLTAADHVIHVDRWWNPAVEDQATDRAYRIGQTKPVQVHRLITEGTIEQKIDELLTRKRALAETVLGAGEAALTELSDDELRDLVTLRRPHG